MARRMLGAAAAVLLGLATFGVLTTAAPPVGADSGIDLSMVSGEIVFRDSEDPVELATPTTFTGDADPSGAITSGSFTTPGLTFEVPLFPGLGLTTVVEAELPEPFAAGSVTGDLVELTLQTTMAMHVDLGGGLLEVDCRATPVEIDLSGVYDPLTQQVVLVDEDFTFPALVPEAPCNDLREQLDAVLAGPGHSIELVMEGPVEIPAAAPEVAVELGGYVIIGGPPREATVTVDNPAEGADLDNARVSVTLAREDLGASSLDPGQVEVELLAPGDTWEPVPLTQPEDRVVAGSVGAATGFALPVDSSRTVQLRISVPELATPASAGCLGTETACPGAVALTVTVDEVDPATGSVVRAGLDEAVRHFFFVEP
jgi:hypothetical protein